MSIIVVGTSAFDDIRTPRGFKRKIIQSGLLPIAKYLLPLLLSRQTNMDTDGEYIGIKNIIK